MDVTSTIKAIIILTNDKLDFSSLSTKHNTYVCGLAKALKSI